MSLTEVDRPAAPLAITLFGSLEVRLGGEPRPPLRARKAQWLLALLALQHGREVERAWLAGTLWPDASESQAFFYLRRTLTELRQWLGPAARQISSPTVRTLCLDRPGVEVDVVAFDEAVARGDSLSLEQAVALYRGPLLASCQEEWALPERAARDQAYLQALETLATQATARGDHAAAAGHLRRVVAGDPFRESGQRALLQALAAGGEHAAAILAYREFRLVLRRELNAEPDPETTALFRQLRAEARRAAAALPASGTPAGSLSPAVQAAPPPSPVGRLPQPLSSFVGRERELREIEACLASARLVTLTGAGGVGKTRLAIQVAGETVEDYPDGVWFVDLAPLTDPGLVPQAVAQVLGVREERGAPLTATLQTYLHSRQLLLVLDNCEHLIEACAHLAEALLGGCSRLRVLATSRQPLGLPGETSWRVPSLYLPPSPERWQERLTPEGEELVPILLGFGAVRLFVERGRAAVPGFTLTERNWQAAVAVCRQLEGIPLAIELAAARLKALTVEQLAARLEDRLRLLTWGSRTALPRQQTLRATLDWSYDLLNEAERVLLRRLSVFAGGFTLEAAEAVCADPVVSSCPLPTDDVLDLLGQLVDKSLVLLEEAGGEGRYRLLETIRQYGQERLRGSVEEALLRARHRDCFLGLAERAEAELRGPRQGEWLERLEREHDNLRAALEGLVEAGASPDESERSHERRREAEAALRLSGALWQFWDMRGYLTEGRQRLAALLALAEARTAARAKGLSAAGNLAFRQADYRAARELHEEALSIQRELGDKRGMAGALNNLAIVAMDQGEYGAVRSLLEESIALQRELGNPRGLAQSLNNLGNLAMEQEQPEEARSLYEESLAIKRELGDQQAIANSLINLGNLASEQGKGEEARSLYEESLAILRELGDRRGIAIALYQLGTVALERGEWEAARALLEESLAIKQDLGDKLGIAECLAVLAEVASSRGQVERAARLFGAAEALRELLGAPRPRSQRVGVERHVAGVRAALGEEAFAAAWAAGRAMTLAAAVAEALASPHAPSGEGAEPVSRCPGSMGQPGDAAAAKLSALGAS